MNKTCKDCIHYECCCGWTSKDAIDMTSYAMNDGVIAECEHFKPKDRFIELPCAVGDDIWWIDSDDNTIKCAKNEIRAVAYYGEGHFKIISKDEEKPEEIGTRWSYLSRADAEKALKGGAE